MDIFEYVKKSKENKSDSAPKQSSNTSKKKTIQFIHYKKLIPCKDNDLIYENSPRFSREAIIQLAESIDICGEIKEPLIVRKINIGEYEIVAGHRRRMASVYLVEEENKDEYAMLPCIVEDTNDVMSRFNLIITNVTQGERTDADKFREAKELTEIINELSSSGEIEKITARNLREFLSQQLNVCKTKVAQYQNIDNNLQEGIKENFMKGSIGVSVANELAGLPEEKQIQLYEEKGNDLKINDIKEIKKEEAAPKKTPIERGCITGKNPNGTCSCCGNGGTVDCCAQCKEDCNIRCGWLDEDIESSKIAEHDDTTEEPEVINETDDTENVVEHFVKNSVDEKSTTNNAMTEEQKEQYRSMVKNAEQGILAGMEDEVAEALEEDALKKNLYDIKSYINYAIGYLEKSDYENCHFYLLSAIKKMSDTFEYDKENLSV